jgi:hypothetical protein
VRDAVFFVFFSFGDVGNEKAIVWMTSYINKV